MTYQEVMLTGAGGNTEAEGNTEAGGDVASPY